MRTHAAGFLAALCLITSSFAQQTPCITGGLDVQESVSYDGSPGSIATRMEVSGPAPLRYRWYDDGFGDIPGATEPELCPLPPAGSAEQCSWGTPHSFRPQVLVTADCGTRYGYPMVSVMQIRRFATSVEIITKPLTGKRRVFAIEAIPGRPYVLAQQFSPEEAYLPEWLFFSGYVWQASYLVREYPRAYIAPGWTPVGVADVNGDQRLDLFLQHPDGRIVVWQRMYGDWQSHYRRDDFFIDAWKAPGWTAKAVADFDGDQKPDLVLENDVTRQTVIWKLDGVHVLDTETFLPLRSPGWNIVGAADFDGNGSNDLLLRHGDDIVVWRMAGLSVVDTQGFPADPRPLRGFEMTAVGDIDGDGRPDLIGVTPNGARTSVFVQIRWSWDE